jgi:uncharacterized protein YbjT (DUF2867 family)
MVAGATGYIGGSVAKALKDAGFWVRGLTRSSERLKTLTDVDDVFIGQATRPETLNGLCDGIDVAFSSIGIHEFVKKPSIWEVDYQGNLNIVAEAKKAGVKHFIFVSVVHGPEMARVSPIAEAREKVVKAIIDSGMSYTIYRPTGFFNDIGYLFQGIVKKRVARLYGNPEVRINPLHGLDFGEEVAKAIDNPEFINTMRAVGGPEIFRRRDMAELAFESLGIPSKIQVRPAWIMTLLAYAIRPFNYNLFALFRFLVFSFVTADMTGELIGYRKLKDFFDDLAREI